MHLNYSALARCTLCFPFKGVRRECSVRSNHPELMLKLYTPWYFCNNEGSKRFLAFQLPRTIALYLFCIPFKFCSDAVREGSMHFNYPELVHKHAVHFAVPRECSVQLKVRTTPNSCLRTLHTLLSLQ